MNVETAPLLYEMALARLHAAEVQIETNQENCMGEWRMLMTMQKVMAQAELDALDKVLRNHGTTPAAELLLKEASEHGFFPSCTGRVIDYKGRTLCNNLESENYSGPCDKNCNHNVEE